MAKRIVLVTGSLAEPRVKRIAGELNDAELEPIVASVGVKVAALMTTEIVERRLKLPENADRVILPGRFRGDIDRLSDHFGTRFERGPEEIADLPAYLGQAARKVDLSEYDVTIFGEIVDATLMKPEQIVERSRKMRADGADVIDLGCLPDSPFPHLEESIAALHADGAKVSVDSFNAEELSRATRAGADYLFSLNEKTISIVDEGPATPILISAGAADMDSLDRVIDIMIAKGRPFYADPILDPIHYGFTASVARYYDLRKRRPDIPILMGIGNVTELTDADTTGINALLMGMCSELHITAVLAVQVSPHCRTAIKEFDRARREFFAARKAEALPQGFGEGLMALRDRKGFASSPEEIKALAAEIRDQNYRIEVAEDGIHIYNRNGHHVSDDPFQLYPHIDTRSDPGHAFYLGVETARAEIAYRLGKRYAQDEPLQFGVVGETKGSADDAHLMKFKEAGSTFQKPSKTE
ncbi:MAG: dihydropteroate synthase [Proteobacteria bacterium]|nr:dihydropteroate synthase [Pseudomonadota bacterium]MBS0269335.1 dihydropteroate synthase [Pseudomonadota bacterium]